MTVRQVIGTGVAWIPLAFLVDGVTMLLLPVRLAGFDGTATALGLISFLGLGFALLVQPLAGLVSDRVRDRVDRRAFMVGSALPAIAGLWVLAGPTAVPLAALGYVVLQAGASALQAALQALIPEQIAPTARGRAAGWKTSFDLGGAFLAFVVLGLLLADGNAVAAATTTTGLLIGALALVIALVPGRRPPGASEPGVASSAAAAEHATPPRRGHWPAGFARLITARFLFLLGAFGVSRFLLLMVADRLEIAPSRAADEAGLLLAALALLTVLAAVPLGRLADRRGRLPVMAMGVVLSAAGILALVPSAGVAGVLIGGALMSGGTAAFVTANWAALTDLAPGPDAGRLMGIANIGTGGAAASAGLLGPLIDAGGFGPALAVAAAATACALLPVLVRSGTPGDGGLRPA
ncbi:MAG: MFS transporter [Chloroflexi bacterium]|nr:MFS transporter [Chloroflexota bacterium]